MLTCRSACPCRWAPVCGSDDGTKIPEQITVEYLETLLQELSGIIPGKESPDGLPAVLRRVSRFWPVQVKDLVEEAHEPYVYDIAVADNENFLTASGIFVHNSRAGAQVPFSSLNLGTDTSEEGELLRAF